jgi:hypothetical protein
MRRAASLLVLPLILASGSALKAQSPHVGFSLNLIVPTGDFASKTYNNFVPPERETYDVGIGGSFTLSFPVERALAIRLNLSGSTEDGTNRKAGFDNVNLRHSMFNVGGDLQIFPAGSAFRHRGFYLLAGLSADFEKFERSSGDFSWWNTNVNTTNKSRMGGSLGFGHSFGYDSGMRFTLEATFHKTLTAHDVEAGEPPATDFVKVGFGWVF